MIHPGKYTLGDKVITCMYMSLSVVSLATVTIIASPILAVKYGCDGLETLYHKIKNRHKKQTPQPISIQQLRIWQEHVQSLNQFERAILQILEADDIPRELWWELTNENENDNDASITTFFTRAKTLYGTPEYPKDVAVIRAHNYYISKYSQFMKRDMTEDVYKLVRDVGLLYPVKKIDTYS